MNSKAILCGFAVFCVVILTATSFLCLNDCNTQTNNDFDDLNGAVQDGTAVSDGDGDLEMVPSDDPAIDCWRNGIAYDVKKDEGYAVVEKFSSDISDVYVPDTIEYKGVTYPVTKIGTGGVSEGGPRTVSIGPNVDCIYMNAFRSISKWWGYNNDGVLEKFTIRYIEDSKLERIGTNAFRGQKNLTSIELPASLKTIDNSVFRDSGIQTCVLHSTALEICESAFRNTPLKSINLEGVTVLGNGAFHECTNLTYADLSSIQSLAQTTFRNCPLEKVIIGNNLTSIRSDSFYTTEFYDGSGTEIDVSVENLRNHTFERIDGKLVMVS